jgi:multifunctional methyltransferase subunit TRM112
LAADTVGCGQDLPDEFQQEIISNDTDVLQKLHHILLEIDIINGSLTCPETGRVFAISNGIPNMLLNEDEI